MIVPHVSACSSYRPQRLKTPFVRTGHIFTLGLVVVVDVVFLFVCFAVVGWVFFVGVCILYTFLCHNWECFTSLNFPEESQLGQSHAAQP